MTLNELKAAVRALFNGNHEVANHWVKENFGNLTKKQTWQDAYDRLSESIATAADKTIESTKEAAIELRDTALLLADNCDGLPIAICETAHGAATWLIGSAIVTLLAVQEYLNPGHIDRLREDMAKLQAEQEAFEIGMKAPKPAFAKYSIADLNRLSALQIRSLAQSEALPVRYEGRFIKTNDLRWMLLEVPAA